MELELNVYADEITPGNGNHLYHAIKKHKQ